MRVLQRRKVRNGIFRSRVNMALDWKKAAMARKLDIAFWTYDRTRLLADGTVKIDGVDATFHSARIVPEIFEAMVRQFSAITTSRA